MPAVLDHQDLNRVCPIKRADDDATRTSPRWWLKTSSHWLLEARKHIVPVHERYRLLKRAAGAPGMAGQETAFEQAMANLCHSVMRDRAPKLMAHEVGFQVIEVNEDKTRSVGVIGFRLGKQWLYAPQFFLNGAIKGQELLYIVQTDLFVPSSDGWIGYLIGRKPPVLGRSVDRNIYMRGVMPPSLLHITRSPYKYAAARTMVCPTCKCAMDAHAGAKCPSCRYVHGQAVGSDAQKKAAGPAYAKIAMPDIPLWLQPFMPALASLVATPPAELLKSAASKATPFDAVMLGDDGAVLDYLLKTGERYPGVLQAVLKFHGGDALLKMAQRVREKRARSQPTVLESLRQDRLHEASPFAKLAAERDMDAAKAAPKDGEPWHIADPVVHLREDYWMGGGADVKISPDDKEKLLLDGRLVKDDRPDTAIAKVYKGTTSLKLSNPTETGIYDVLVKPHLFRQCLVICAPYGATGHQNFATVVDLETKEWFNTHAAHVFCKSCYSRDAWNEWYKSQPDADGLKVSDDWADREICVIFGQTGQGTTPIQARQSYTDGDESKYYSVNFEDHAHHGRPYTMPDSFGWRDGDHEHDRPHLRYVRFTGRDGVQLKGLSEDLLVPAGYKKLTVKSRFGRGDKREFEPGNLVDLSLAIQSTMKRMDLVGDENFVEINGKRMRKEAAFRHLLVDWRLREDMADAMLKWAASFPRRRQEYLLDLRDIPEKRAAMPFLSEETVSAPPHPDPIYTSDPYQAYSRHPAPVLAHDQRELLVPDLRPDPANILRQRPLSGPDSDADIMREVQNAAQMGDKALFDTGMFNGMLKSISPHATVDRYIPGLTQGMDSAGRLYFQLLWHGEQFEDRYGKQDIPELEDSLRNNFESSGELVLKLRQKGVDPFAQYGTDTDLSAIAGQA